MTEKRFKMKKLEYDAYFIDSQQEYVDEYVPKFEIDGERTMSDSQILDLLNENEQLKVRLNDLNDENEWLKSEIQKLYNFVKIDVDRNIEVYPKSLMEPILEILKIIGDVE